MTTAPTPSRAPAPLSVLDLAIVKEGGTSADALHETVTLARRAEALGFRRFWVAEHHNMPSVASTSPAVLIAQVAASTERIVVGSGGVMLPNHATLAVAEQFALLEALHPGRIDLGIGRAPGTDPSTAAALRGARLDAAEDFPRHLIDLLGLLGDRRTEHGLWERFRATPVATSSPAVVLLGSSGYSAQLAGLLGLPFAFAHHFDTGGTMDAVDRYREAFEPSPVLDEPYVIVTSNVLAAASEEEAEYEAAPGRLLLLAIRTGRFRPLPTPAVAAADPDLATARRMTGNRIVGTGRRVAEGLRALAAATGAAEVMLTTVAYDVEVRARSLELVSAAWSAGSV